MRRESSRVVADQVDSQPVEMIHLGLGTILLDDPVIDESVPANAQRYPVATTWSVALQCRAFQTPPAKPVD
jgi:hypothetical protein